MGKKKGGQPGNTNAEKWTEEVVRANLAVMLDMAKSSNYRTIGKLCLDNDLSPFHWSEWALKFKGNSFVLQAIKEIERIVEANLVEQAMDGNANSTMAIFTLKNKHGWEDKRTQENTGANGGPIKIEGYTLITPNDD